MTREIRFLAKLLKLIEIVKRFSCRMSIRPTAFKINVVTCKTTLPNPTTPVDCLPTRESLQISSNALDFCAPPIPRFIQLSSLPHMHPVIVPCQAPLPPLQRRHSGINPHSALPKTLRLLHPGSLQTTRQIEPHSAAS